MNKAKISKKETYYFLNSDNEPDKRVTDIHPLIGQYVVRASVVMDEECRAVVCCEWLNKMVEDRREYYNGIRAMGVAEHMNLFKVVNYKSSLKTFVVVRKLQVDDLVSGIDEFVEVKRR